MQTYGEETYEPEKEKQRKDYGNGFPTWACWVLFIIGWAGLEVISLLVQIILNKTPLKITASETADPTLYAAQYTRYITWGNFIIYLILALAIGLFFYFVNPTYFKSRFKSLVNSRTYLWALYFFLGMNAASFAYGLLEQALETVLKLSGDNANQSAMSSMILYQPLPMFFMVVFLAPFCEELTYRQGLFEAISRKSRPWAYVAVIIVFALIHVTSGIIEDLITIYSASSSAADITSAQNSIKIEFLSIPTYMIGAGFMAWCYEHEGHSFVSSMLVHMMNNILSFISIIYVSSASAASSSGTASSLLRLFFRL